MTRTLLCSFCMCCSVVAAGAAPAAAQTLPVAATPDAWSQESDARSLEPEARSLENEARGSEPEVRSPQRRVPGITDLFKDTITDFRRLPSTEAVTWLAIGGLAASMGHSADGSVTGALSGAKGMDRLFAPGETIGGARFQLAAALAAYGIGRASGHGTLTEVGGDLVRANILAQALTSGIKLSVRRGRPDGTQYSFPSGHTSVSFAAATVLQRHFGWKAGVPAYAAASYVAASRIQEKRHFLSDVAFGAVVGIVAGRTVTVGRGNHRFALEPTVPRGGGIGFAFTKR